MVLAARLWQGVHVVWVHVLEVLGSVARWVDVSCLRVGEGAEGVRGLQALQRGEG